MNNIALLEENAVEAAISQDWKKAIEINLQILKKDKQNLDASLRIGFAQIQIGALEEAKKYYKKALRLRPGHPLAKQNLDKIELIQKKKKKKGAVKRISFDPNLFLEAPGRTRSVPLVMVGQKETIAHLTTGEHVALKTKKHKVEVRADDGEYIGSLPDDLSKRMLLFIRAGSSYEAFIKEVEVHSVTIFIREIQKGKKVEAFTSFPEDMQRNLAKLESLDSDTATTDEEEDSHLEFERYAQDLEAEDKLELEYHERPSDDEDEENIE